MVWKHISTSFRVSVKDKSSASDCSPFSNFQWLFGLLRFWHDHVGSSEKSQTFSHTWGLDIRVSFYAVDCLHAVFVIVSPVSPALCNLSSIEQSVQLRNGEIPVPCTFPQRYLSDPNCSTWVQSKEAFSSLPAAAPQKNVIFNNEQCIVNKWSRHLIIISWFKEQRWFL